MWVVVRVLWVVVRVLWVVVVLGVVLLVFEQAVYLLRREAVEPLVVQPKEVAVVVDG